MRRKFLKSVAIMVLSALLMTGFITAAWWFGLVTFEQSNVPVEVEEAVEMALWADRLADSIEDMYPPPPRDREDAFALMLEIAPYAVYERILPEEYYNKTYAMRVKSRETLPDIELRHYGGDASFHILGTADCFNLEEPVFNMTIRYYNPYSPWYRRAASQVATLTHELLHMQGICTDVGKGDDYNRDVESATQIATLEILAAMTTHGNPWGLLPFLRDIEDYAADVVLLWAVENDDLDYYRVNVLNKTANDAYRLAGFEKSMAHWFSTYALRFRLVEILSDYGAKPYEYLMEALDNKDYMTRELPFPNKKRTISMDDTAYVLEHILELVEDYPEILE